MPVQNKQGRFPSSTRLVVDNIVGPVGKDDDSRTTPRNEMDLVVVVVGGRGWDDETLVDKDEDLLRNMNGELQWVFEIDEAGCDIADTIHVLELVGSTVRSDHVVDGVLL